MIDKNVFKRLTSTTNYYQKKKVFPPWYHIKVGTRKVMFWLFNYNQVDEMIVFIVGTDGGEELFERSLMSGW